jgi:hypothetical protein
MPSDDLIDYTIRFRSSRYGREITREGAREILANLTGFFEILLEWDREAKAAKEATVTSSDAPMRADPSADPVEAREHGGVSTQG